MLSLIFLLKNRKNMLIKVKDCYSIEEELLYLKRGGTDNDPERFNT